MQKLIILSIVLMTLTACGSAKTFTNTDEKRKELDDADFIW